MRKLLLICSVMLLYTNAFGVKRSRSDYDHDQSQTYSQKSNRKENFKKYDTNRSNYASDKGKSKLIYRKNNYKTLNPHKREIKKREMLDKEREGVDALFDNYNYWEAFNFFKEVSDSESYPLLTWRDNEVSTNRLWKADFGNFDQRKKFVDMFENYDGKGANICIRIDFSYGGLRHDMFIEQPERSREYSTDKFLFQNNVNFDEKRDSYTPGYVKPYLSKKNKDGILAKFINHPEKIQEFARNVLRIMKLSQKGISPINLWEKDINRALMFESFEIAGMILSTERLRSKKSLLLSYIEFYKLKYTKNHKDSLSMLLDMFDKDGPTLRFPASPGGVEFIQKTHPYYIYKRFLDMLKYSPKYSVIQRCKNKDIQRKLMDEFFRGKLEKIRAVLENRQPKFKSKFKSAVQDYQQNNKGDTAGLDNKTNYSDKNKLNSSQKESTDEYRDDFLDNLSESDYNTILNNAKLTVVTQNETNYKGKSNVVQKADNNPDEYFDVLDSLSDLDYESVLSSIKSGAVPQNKTNLKNINNATPKIENNIDEYRDDFLDNLSESDYNAILNNAVFKNIKIAR